MKIRPLKLHKTMKAQGGDWLVYLVYLLVGAIGIFIAGYVLSQIMQAAPVLFNKTTNPVGAQVGQAGQASNNYLQTLLLLIFIGAMIASAISGSQVDTVPALAFVGVVVLIVGLASTIIFHNVYFDFIQNSAFVGFAPPSTVLLMFQFLPLLGLIAFFVVMIFTYGHGGSSGGGQGAYRG